MLLKINPQSSEPLYLQLRQQIILGLACGQLNLGESLPSVRQMAEELGMNMMTVSKAYNALKDEGYLVIDRRSGTKIADKIGPSEKFTQDFQKETALLLADFFNRGGSLAAAKEEIEKIYEDFHVGGKNHD